MSHDKAFGINKDPDVAHAITWAPSKITDGHRRGVEALVSRHLDLLRISG